MAYVLPDEYVEKIKKIAEERCWADDPDFLVDDYAGGNEDDAYYGGERAGEIQFARTVLDAIGVEYTVENDDE